MSTQPDAVAQYSEPFRPMVFYDGGCPLCRREIAHYRRIDSAERLVLGGCNDRTRDTGRAWPLPAAGNG